MGLFVRIDDRLVHGQVVEAWVPHLGVSRIVVVSEEAVGDETAYALMRMALPDDIDLAVLTVARAADLFKNVPGSENILVLLPGPEEALRLIEAGARFSRVNVGGLHYSAGRVQLGRAVFLSEADRGALRELGRRGVSLEGRGVPSDPEDDILTLIEGKA